VNQRDARVTHPKFLLVFVTVVLALGLPLSAQAADTETVVQGRYLTLTSIGDLDAMGSLVPGRPVLWQVGVQAHPPTISQIDIGISAQGPLSEAGGLQIEIHACTVRWVNGVCVGIEELWLPNQDVATAVVPVAAYGARLLGTMKSTDQRWLLIRATLPTERTSGSTAELSIHAWGPGDEIETGRKASGPLASTGSSLWPAIGLAALPLIAGIGVAAVIRRRPLGYRP
jgi:signal peptidase